jgi:hypothetical protein
MNASFFIFIMLAIAVLLFFWSQWRQAGRANYIRHYTFPTGLFDKLRKKRPELSTKDCQLVANALRQFFLAYLSSGRRFVSMPSQAADDLWHELILYTRHYDQFCSRAFGRFMHHTPAVVLSANRQNNTGLRRCWWYACKEEKINPKQPARLPLLFALDSKLGIADGFVYHPDCAALRHDQSAGNGSVHCGGDFSSSSFDGSTDGFGDASSGDGGDGGSDGGDGGCGGGCGGGD